MTPSMERVLALLRVPARCCQPSLRLHRGERGRWRGAGGCPIPSLPRAIRLGSGSPAELQQQQQRRAAPPAAAPLFVPSQSVATKTPAKAKPGTGGLAGNARRLVMFVKPQTARGGGGTPTKTRQNGKWIRDFKGGQRWGPSEGEGDSSGCPAAPRRGAHPYGVRARDPCPGTPGQSPAMMPRQGKPQNLQLAFEGQSCVGAEEAAVPVRLQHLGTQLRITPALPRGTSQRAHLPSCPLRVTQPVAHPRGTVALRAPLGIAPSLGKRHSPR